MLTKIAVLAGYFILVLVLGFVARKRAAGTPGDYFLAGRGLGSFVLTGTMAATNFSAFTVFGASGAGYQHGLAFFPILGFGTGFMVLTFWFIGRKAHALGKLRNLITPAELVQECYQHRTLSTIFALVMIVFTIPYLALQPMAGGYVLHQLFGLPQAAGAGLITLIILLYTLRGGMRAVVWTDVFQGLLMLGLLLLALIIAAGHHGGLASALGRVLDSQPELFSRPGAQGWFGPGIWFSYLALWFFCDPMFPQLFQRFYTARDERTLARGILFYPLLCTVVFALPVLLGMLGRLEFPGLAGKETDAVLPMLMTSIGGDFMGTLVLAAGLAALMSTMDSQLLTLASIFSRDVYPMLTRGRKGSTLTGRLFVCFLALAGLAMAVNPPATILAIATQAFTGLAVLFPTVLFGLYLKKPRPAPALGSILVGQALVLLYGLEVLPLSGVLPVLPVMLGTFGTYAVLHLIAARPHLALGNAKGWKWASVFGLLFLAAQDYWRWGEVGPLLLGVPLWAWYFVGLSLLQTGAMALWLRPGQTPDTESRP
jgi:solute:Na+ symporter, SSS family